MHKSVTTLMLLLLVLCLKTAHAAPRTDPKAAPAKLLTLDDAVETALRQQPSLRKAEASVAAAEAEVRIARSAYFPQLSFDAIIKAGLSGATGALALPGFPASPDYRNVAFSANWYQSIFDFGRIKHTVAMERALYHSSQFKRQTEQQRVVLDVKRAYFTVLEAQEEESVATEALKVQRLNSAKAKSYEATGFASALTLNVAKTHLAQAKAELVRSQNALAVSVVALRTAMGVDSSQRYRLQAPSFHLHSPPPLSGLVDEAMKNRPDERAVEFKTQALRENLGLARAQSRPNLNGFGAGGGGRFNGTTVPDNQRHGVAALGVLVPIFTGGRLRAQRDEARAELKGAQAAELKLHQQIRLEVTQAWFQISDLAIQLKSAQQERLSAEETYDLSHAQAEAGLGSDMDMLSARVALMKIKGQNLLLQMDIEQAQAQLNFATGKERFGGS